MSTNPAGETKRQQILRTIIKSLEADGMVFGNDPHTLSMGQVEELRDFADAMRFKGSQNSSLGQGRLFYMHLTKLKALT